MNSFPCISHHLFVAAVNDADRRRTARPRKNAPVLVVEPAQVLQRERADHEGMKRTVIVQPLEP